LGDDEGEASGRGGNEVDEGDTRAESVEDIIEARLS